MHRELVIGGFYRHFKNKLYQVRGIAYHSETKEKMVVYQALYGDFALYVRPYDMFLSEVDHAKYPEVTRKYRFTEVDPSELARDSKSMSVSGRTSASELTSVSGLTRASELTSVSELTSASEPTSASKLTGASEKRDDSKDSESPDSILMDFLDIDTYGEKLKYLDTVRENLTDKVIDAMAASLDVEVSGSSIDERYRSLKQVVSAHARYECTRLRG